MTSTLVVTGATGWFGQAFLESAGERAGALSQLYDSVRCLSSADSLDSDPGRGYELMWQRGDLRVADSLAQLFPGEGEFDVVHASGVIHPKSVADFDAINHQGTRNLLAGAIATGRLRHFVHMSSNSPFGLNADDHDEFRANEPYRPYLGYGRSKWLAELAVRELLTDAGVSGVILRPPWFYGPYQPERQAKFLRTVRLGTFPMPRPGTNRRSMVDVRSLAEATWLALDHRVEGVPGYWIADAQPYSMIDIIATVREAAKMEGLEVRRERVRVPGFAMNLAGRVDEFLQAKGKYISEVHVAGELNKSIACRVDTAIDELGFQPRESNLDGMRQSYRYGLLNGQTV